jgi:hypothetical protein
MMPISPPAKDQGSHPKWTFQNREPRLRPSLPTSIADLPGGGESIRGHIRKKGQRLKAGFLLASCGTAVQRSFKMSAFAVGSNRDQRG